MTVSHTFFFFFRNLDTTEKYCINSSFATAKYHVLHSLINRNCFLPVLQAGSLIPGHQHGQMLIRVLLLAYRQPLSHCVLMWWGERLPSLIRPLWWPHLTLTTSPRHRVMPRLWIRVQSQVKTTHPEINQVMHKNVENTMLFLFPHHLSVSLKVNK